MEKTDPHLSHGCTVRHTQPQELHMAAGEIPAGGGEGYRKNKKKIGF